MSSIAFLLLGFGLMFGDGSPYVGMQGLCFVGGADNSPLTGKDYQGVYSALNWTGTPLWTKFFFQLVFAGTAARSSRARSPSASSSRPSWPSRS